MKKTAFFIIIGLLFGLNVVFAQQEDLTIGNVAVPMDFVHEGREYSRGVYHVVLTYQDEIPVFLVHDGNREFLFSEMAAVKPNRDIKVRNYRVRRQMLKENEYFRLMVIKPEKLLMAYFLIKK